MARKNKNLSIIDHYDLESPYSTEFRRLLYHINGSVEDKNIKTILVTSAMLSEGKSTVAAFLAITAAAHKKRKTLLIDCDLRRPTLHRLFNIPREQGVTEIILGERKVRDVLKKTSIEQLNIVTAGKAVSEPAAIFDSNAIQQLLEEVQFYYDLILIDCAPVLPVSDPMLLASEMDGVLLVLKAGATQREVAKRAIQLLANNNSQLLGVVVNNLSNTLPYYYKDSYYGYEYRVRPKK
jgi:capsular exopolysaccharide synthesis family protein